MSKQNTLNEEMKCYRHIEEKDRRKIAKFKSYKLSVSEIARRTGFNKSTISRELKRNGGTTIKRDRTANLAFFHSQGIFDYSPKGGDYQVYTRRMAQVSARWRRKEASQRKRIHSETDRWITAGLMLGWSPQQIAGRSHREGPQKVSHEYIYSLIIKNRRDGGKLHRLLKRFGKRKQRLGKRVYNQATIPGRISIAERPKIVDSRCRLGDLEGDLIVGRYQKSHLLTIVDRRSRFLAIELLKSRKKDVVEQAFLKALKRMPQARTLTLDNAREFSCHQNLTKQTGLKVYFADPYSSYQRGTNENTNGLIRYYLPKGYDFRRLSQNRLAKIEKLLNTRPRKVLKYQTPEEVSLNT